MVGIMLMVFVRSELYDAITNVDVQWVGTGLFGSLVDNVIFRFITY